jgi:hypothetical protein
MKKIVRLTESDLARIVKRVINEEMDAESLTDTGSDFSSVIKSLKTFNSPKIINFQWKGKPMTTLNWGKMSDRGKDKSWGYAIGTDGKQTFLTTNPKESKLFEKTMGVKTNKYTENYSWDGSIDPTNAVTKVKELINGLLNMA